MKYIKYSLSIFSLLFIVFSLNSNQAFANHSPEKVYGYYSSLVDYIDDNSSCDPDEVSFDIWLVNPGTKTPVSGSVGDWWYVDIRDINNGYSYLRTNWVGVDKNKSGRLCYDIDNEAIDIGVYNSPDYHFFGSSAIDSTDRSYSSRQEMKGKHFRGYVELVGFSETTPYVEALFPSFYSMDYLPDFQIRVNTISNIYNATTLREVGIFIQNSDGSVKYQVDVDDYGGTGDRYISAPIGMPDDEYYWTPTAQLDGYVETEKYDWPTYTWITTETPFYGLADYPIFAIDRTAPTASFDSITVNPSSEATTSVQIEHITEDELVGVATTTIFVTDVVAGTTNAIVLAYEDYNEYTVNETVIVDNLVRGRTYEFYSESLDWLDNTYTTPVTSLVIPGPPVVINPTVSNITETSADLGATVDSDGGSSVTERGTCWDVTDTFASEQCASAGSGLGVFSHSRNGMTGNTTIYFRGYAVNSEGTGYSATANFNTSPSLPEIVNTGAINIDTDSADLRADVTSDGGATVTIRGTCWNTDDDFSNPPSTADCENASGGGVGTFTHSRTGLTEDSTIYYVSYAENSEGRTYSNSTSFVTSAPVPPPPVDPELELISQSELIRSGDTATLEWKMLNVPEDLECTIVGSSTLDSFTHTALPAPATEDSGTVETNPITSTQTFTFTCDDVVSSLTYSTSTKVRVAGGHMEI